MAIARGAGTEIIRSGHFEDVDSTQQKLIVGVQHHIYTVLNIIVFTVALNVATDRFSLQLTGYDAKAGTSAQDHRFLYQKTAVDTTFIWDAKIVFNGHEPTDFSGPMDDAAKQDAIADQGSSVAQILFCSGANAADSFEVDITYIDQNNA